MGDPLPRFPTNRAFRYYRTDNFGATGVKYFNSVTLFGWRIPTKATVRLEFTYKEGVHFNRYLGQGVYGVTQRDIIGYAVDINRDWLPPLITRFNGYRRVSTTFAMFQDWILGFDRNLGLSGYDRGQGDKCSTILNFSASTDWLKQTVDTRFSIEQAAHSNFGSFWASIMYAPGDHWRWTFLWRTAWSRAGPNSGKRWTEKDDTLQYFVFKMGYQF